MRRPARIQDVAAAAGVSVATVSNALNRPEKVSPATTAKVLSTVRELDYVPHPGASGLRSGRVLSIGLVLPTVGNSFYARIIDGAAGAAYDHGYSLVLCHSGDDPEREEGHFSMLVEQRSAGAVVVPLTADPARLSRLADRGIPVVLADRAITSRSGCSVGVDDVTGGRLAVEHLLQGGCRDVVVVNGDRAIRQCQDRMAGAVEAVRAVGGARLREVTVEDMTIAAGAAAVPGLVGSADGVFCVNDFVAVGVVQGLRAAGTEVPRDVRVVGFGDLDVAAIGPTTLTTVRQPVEELGRASVHLLVEEVAATATGAQHVHQARVFTPQLVVRDSAP